MTSGLVATPIEFMATHTPTNNLNEWKLGKQIATALKLKEDERGYVTQWGSKNPIALVKALRAILKN